MLHVWRLSKIFVLSAKLVLNFCLKSIHHSINLPLWNKVCPFFVKSWTPLYILVKFSWSLLGSSLRICYFITMYMNFPLKRGMAFHLINFVSSSYKDDYSKNLLEISAVSTEWSCLPTASLYSVFYGDFLEIRAVTTEWSLSTTSLD